MPKTKRIGNGAREKLLKYFGPNEARICAVDHMLAWLWLRGYAVKPLSKKDLRDGLISVNTKKRKRK